MSLVIVIPAYDAAEHIEGVLGRIASSAGAELERLVVVNDGSRDGTAQAVRRAQFLRCPLTLIDRPRNGGYGAALKDGLEAACQGDPDLVACVHADGQYSPEVLPAMCVALHERGLDLL